MTRRCVRHFARMATALLCAGITLVAAAQATKGASEYNDSRVDIYGGYGWFHPVNSGISNGTDHFQYQDIDNLNATAAVGYFFNRYVGVQMEGGYFSGNGEHHPYSPNCSFSECDQLIYTAEAGPVLRFPLGKFVPYIHMLGGGERTNGPVDQHLMWGWGVTGGIGVDYILPVLKNHLALRGQADYQYSQVVYGPLVLPAGTTGGFGEIDALKVSGGLVLRLGSFTKKEPLLLGCTLDPISVYAGDPILVTGSTINLNPKKMASYEWQSNGGKLSSHGQTASIDTTGMAPGDYTVNGRVYQGPKLEQQATCSVPFNIKQILPPTLTCAANPSAGPSGTTIEITTTGTSHSNRPLTYSYAASAGTLTANGPTATLTTAGLGASTITVNCNVADDLGQRAAATTEVTLSNPVVPVIPQAQPLCSISFMRDTRRPVRVDNEAKACLDDIALNMSQQADARLVMIGNSSPDEHDSAAAERTLNARQYLTQEKAVDASRIEVRVGQTSGRTVNNVLVPSGATFLDSNTQSFDETQIVRHGQAYGVPKGSLGYIAPSRHKTLHHIVRRRTASGRRGATTTLPSSTTPLATPEPRTDPGPPVTSIPPLQ